MQDTADCIVVSAFERKRRWRGRSMATVLTSSQKVSTRGFAARVSSSRILLICRTVAPLILIAAAFHFRRQLVDFIQGLSGLEFVFTVVHVYSSLGARLIVGGVAFAALAAVGVLSFRFLPKRTRIAVFTVVCATIVGAVLWYMGRGLRTGIVCGLLSGCLVAANALSRVRWNALVADPPYARLLNILFWFGVGAEMLLPRAYLAWIERGRGGTREHSAVTRILPSAGLSAVALAAFAPFPALMYLGQILFMSPAATIVFGPEYAVFSKYDVSDIARNPANGDVFLCGNGQKSPKVLRGGNGPAIDTKISVGGNEFCELGGPRALVAVDNGSTDILLDIDPDTLNVRSRMPLPRMPYGEIFLAVQPKHNLVAVASEDEGGKGGGPAVRIVDLQRMKVIREINAEVGFLIADPTRPVIYANHFAKDIGVRAWDMRTGQLLATSNRFGRSDRMVFDAARNEVLATVPESGVIWRLDATTLLDKAPIHTVFGARGLAVDPARDLLLVSSFITNGLDVIDIKTGKSLRRYRLGPWLRDVLIVGDGGVAFVASRYGLYKVNYLR